MDVMHDETDRQKYDCTKCKNRFYNKRQRDAHFIMRHLRVRNAREYIQYLERSLDRLESKNKT